MKHGAYRKLSGSSVLVVDDEEMVVDVIREALSPIVSMLETATSGEEALVKAVKRDFDSILLDVNMPVMNGMEFFRLIKLLKPHLSSRIILMTGDVKGVTTGSFVRSSGCRTVEKPFGICELLEAMAG